VTTVAGIVSSSTTLFSVEFCQLLFGAVVQSVVHDAELVELDLVDLDAVVLLNLPIHPLQVERLAAFFVVLDGTKRKNVSVCGEHYCEGHDSSS